MRPVADYAVAAAWGGAEATVCFFVADSWLSRIAMTNPKRALNAVLPTLAGAVAGGVATYYAGYFTVTSRWRAAS